VTRRLAESIVEAALENDIEPELAFGLVRAESGFRDGATSHVGAVGLTQLMPRTARWLEPGTTTRDLRDSETNLRIGLGYLRDLIDKYDGDERLALLAYNRGPGTVDKVLRRGGDPDNGYVEKVLAD
jgi:soluble lytic murein transglycosylase-like protein